MSTFLVVGFWDQEFSWLYFYGEREREERVIIEWFSGIDVGFLS